MSLRINSADLKLAVSYGSVGDGDLNMRLFCIVLGISAVLLFAALGFYAEQLFRTGVKHHMLLHVIWGMKGGGGRVVLIVFMTVVGLLLAHLAVVSCTGGYS